MNHSLICSLFDVGEQDGVDYLVMEYLEGETLAARLKKGALPVEEVLRIGAQIAEVLDTLHGLSFVHRDLKPRNIMLTKAGIKLLDFGLSKTGGLSRKPAPCDTAVTETAELTRKGIVVGTAQ
jgi:serine/threonine protein kinase